MSITAKAHELLSRNLLLPLWRAQRHIRPSRRAVASAIRDGLRFRRAAVAWSDEQKRQWILERLRFSVRRAYRDTPLEEPYGQVGYLDFLLRKRSDKGVQVLGVLVDDMFRQRRSLFFKKMQIVRGCDAKRNVLVYMVYSDKLIEGSPKNSTSSVPIMPWGASESSVQKCGDFIQ